MPLAVALNREALSTYLPAEARSPIVLGLLGRHALHVLDLLAVVVAMIPS
jgi:hypothetical protein